MRGPNDSTMDRRAFIGAVGGSLVISAPLISHAQQPALPTVGFLGSRAAQDSTDLIAAFRGGLSEGGFVEHRNVTIEFRWAEGHYDRFPALCAELVARRIAVIVAPAAAPAL